MSSQPLASDAPRMKFQILDGDVLIQLFELLRPDRGLRPLSSTCSWLREATIPVLFKHCKGEMDTTSPLGPDSLPPASSWPYIRRLSLLDQCRWDVILGERFAPRHTDDPTICRAFGPSQFLTDALRSMTMLLSLTLRMRYNVLHGLSWESLEIFLSPPQLREFVVDGFSFCPRLFPGTTESRPNSGAIAPLTSFRFFQDQLRPSPRSYPSERDALAFVLEALCPTLETLELPAESAPLDALSALSWPRLRELTLSGECPTAGLSAPLMSLFSSTNMPALRVLALNFALPAGEMRRPQLLPRGSGALPCSALEDLSISFPDPDDTLFANLPATLRRLSLRCCPHRSVRDWDRNYKIAKRWESPILSASELIRILQQCNAPSLDYLQVEYIADRADADVLPAMASAFPVLRWLEMSRFRRLGSRNNVSIPKISRLLARLKALRSLSLHLDFSDVPQPARGFERKEEYYVMSEEIAEFREKLCARASIVLEGLGRPLEKLWMLERGDGPCVSARWLPFRRVVGESSALTGQVVVDHDQELWESIVAWRF